MNQSHSGGIMRPTIQVFLASATLLLAAVPFAPAAAAVQCPAGTKRVGDYCTYGRTGGVSIGCPKGQAQRGAECYTPPPAGWGWTPDVGTTIGKLCPPNTNNSGLSCWYDRGVGTVPPVGCPKGIPNPQFGQPFAIGQPPMLNAQVQR